MMLSFIMWYLYVAAGFMAYECVTNFELYDQKKDYTLQLVKMINRGLLWPKTVYDWLNTKLFSA